MPIHVTLAMLAALATVLIPTISGASELIPYEPPVPQAAQPTSPPAPSGAKTIVVVPEGVYTQFAIRVSNLDEAQLNQLTALFEQKSVDARRSGDTSREAHYLRLLDVLRLDVLRRAK
jgi:hypothetical protein